MTFSTNPEHNDREATEVLLRFTVCMPASRVGTVQHAIASICRQTWTDWELFVIGQGPESGLRGLVEHYSAQDARVQYLHVEPKGASYARNFGIASARGDVVAFIDDDCEAREDWLAVLAECFAREPETEVVGGAVLAPEGSRMMFSTCPAMAPEDVLYDPVLCGYTPPNGFGFISSNVAIRTRSFERLGVFDVHLGPGTTFPVAEDTDFLLRCEAAGVKMRSTPDAVVYHSYGHRDGLRNLIRLSRNYAWGNGGMAGKLTLLGDPRGREFVKITKWELLTEGLRWKNMHRLPFSLLRVRHYVRAYHHALSHYRADQERKLLIPLSPPTVQAVPEEG